MSVLVHRRMKAFGGAHQEELGLLVLTELGGGGLEHRAGAKRSEDNKSHSFFNKEYVFIQDWFPAVTLFLPSQWLSGLA